MLIATILVLLVHAAPPATPDAPYAPVLRDALERVFPARDGDVGVPAGSRELFYEVLQTDTFLHEAVGPVDVYLYAVDGFAKSREAKKVLDDVVEGLEPLVPVFERHFGRDEGLVSGKRWPVVLVSADAEHGHKSFDEMVALLDHCEAAYTGWVEASGTLWNPQTRTAKIARNWEAMIVNVAHPEAADQGDDFYEHGLGYEVIAHVVNRLLRQGAWGSVPPWVAQGLTDELDIEAYGRSWVGGESYTWETAGWYNAGWSGFLPEGHTPPPTPTGPPADLAKTVRNTGNSWADRRRSDERHWSDLRSDLDSAAPASLAFMAETESFLPRDRAYARLVMHLMLEVVPDVGARFLETLDQEPTYIRGGMPKTAPLPAALAEALGGLARVEELESLPFAQLVEEVGKPEMLEQLEENNGKLAAKIADHRDQAQWLAGYAGLTWPQREAVFNLFLAAEHYGQAEEWRVLGAALDDAARAALDAVRRYPERDRDRAKAAEAFREALSAHLEE